MTTSTELESAFCSNILSLYDSIQSWLPDDQFDFQREQVYLSEEAIGRYASEKLVLRNKNRKLVATLVPIGASVIGADGRVDIQGEYDTTSLLRLEKDGPSLTSADGENTSSTRSFFRTPIEAADWYWIEDKRRGKAHRLTKELFRELLVQVSDFEFA
ncbi:MAG: RolB family protein [Candidatus Hydrogenedentes bacterium]|nr:RolB family protein [Candidatus Hydrogenedentota bacterium]